MKQRQLAEELGVSPSYLSQVRHGKRPISAEVLGVASSKKLSKLLSSEPRKEEFVQFTFCDAEIFWH